jgi:hypothetical protein
MMKKLKLTIALATTLILLVGGTSAAFADCLSTGQIQQAVSSGEILPLNQIVAMAGLEGNAKVLQPVMVCDHGGQLYYELSVLDRSGNASKVRLHALTGAS